MVETVTLPVAAVLAVDRSSSPCVGLRGEGEGGFGASSSVAAAVAASTSSETTDAEPVNHRGMGEATGGRWDSVVVDSVPLKMGEHGMGSRCLIVLGETFMVGCFLESVDIVQRKII